MTEHLVAALAVAAVIVFGVALLRRRREISEETAPMLDTLPEIETPDEAPPLPDYAGVRALYTPRGRCIIFSAGGTWWNLNLRQVHDSLFGPPDPSGVVEFVLEAGALVLSRSADVPALVTGTWPEVAP